VNTRRPFACHDRLTGIAACCVFIVVCSLNASADAQSLELNIQQITSGPKHHFFGYIGQCQTVPWNANDRYILGLEIDSIDRIPRPEEATVIILIDTKQNNKII